MKVWRAKLKCPTCWAETYTLRLTSEQEEKTAIHDLQHKGHDIPIVTRRDPIDNV